MLCYELLIEASFALLKNISIIFDVCLIKVLIVSPNSANYIKMILDVNTNVEGHSAFILQLLPKTKRI